LPLFQRRLVKFNLKNFLKFHSLINYF
jgi:hypothetical protein